MNNRQERIERFATALVTGMTGNPSPSVVFEKAEELVNESDRRYREVLGEHDPDCPNEFDLLAKIDAKAEGKFP